MANIWSPVLEVLWGKSACRLPIESDYQPFLFLKLNVVTSPTSRSITWSLLVSRRSVLILQTSHQINKHQKWRLQTIYFNFNDITNQWPPNASGLAAQSAKRAASTAHVSINFPNPSTPRAGPAPPLLYETIWFQQLRVQSSPKHII